MKLANRTESAKSDHRLIRWLQQFLIRGLPASSAAFPELPKRARRPRTGNLALLGQALSLSAVWLMAMGWGSFSPPPVLGQELPAASDASAVTKPDADEREELGKSNASGDASSTTVPAAAPLDSQVELAAPAVSPPSDVLTGDGVELAPEDVPAPLSLAEQKEYFELLTVFADTLDQVERNYVKEVSRRELMEAAIQGVLSKLDEYSDFIPSSQLDSFRTGVESEFGGIGIRVGLIDGKLTVITPLLNTPAYRAGIRSGDKILKIGDAATEGMPLEDAIQRMKGPIGTPLSLTVQHSTETEPVTLTLQRELVRMETVMGVQRQADHRWSFFHDKNRKIAYIRITSFSRQTFDDLKAALTQLQRDGMRGLVLDLRFNPGGLLSAAIQVADLFLSEGAIVSTVGRNIAPRTWNARKEDSFEGFPMVVLVNRYSASASEIVAACLQDHQRAIVVGERTWGKGSVQNIIELEGGHSALKLTTAGYQRPSGKNIHRFDGATEEDEWGVKPNDGFLVVQTPAEHRRLLSYQQSQDVLLIEKESENATTREREPVSDPQLEKALSYVVETLAQR